MWNKISRYGINEEQSFALQKKIILSNRISLIGGSLVFILMAYNMYIEFELVRVILTSVGIGICVIAIFLNYINLTQVSRLIISILPPILTVMVSVSTKLSNSGNIPFVDYFTHRFILLSSTVLVLIFFDRKTEKLSYWSALIFNLMILISLDGIFELFGVGINQVNLLNLSLDKYYSINVYVILVTIAVISAINFLLSLNAQYEDGLQQSNSQLTRQQEEISLRNQEILAQNEELHQQQEEIMTQRDFIDEKNHELERINKQIKVNSDMLRNTVDQLQQREKDISIHNKALAKRDRKITSSIKSAQTIQQAIQPSSFLFSQLFQDYFIINHPKDLVSGDFYWIDKVDDQVIIAVVDCTGHGVPGAFMTLIGHTLLDKIIRVEKIYTPNQIITRLHYEVKSLLRQDSTGNNNGMDISVINIKGLNTKLAQLFFAGAKHQMLVKKPNEEIIELKGDRRSVGGIQNERVLFTNHTIPLNRGDYIYMFTDGFEDQQNIKRKRLGIKKLKMNLDDIAVLKGEPQKKRLQRLLDEQMVGTDQRDDILLLGFQV